MIGTDELEVRRLVNGLELATFAQRAAIAVTRAESGRTLYPEDQTALVRVVGLLDYLLTPVPAAPRAQAAHALTAQPGAEAILEAADDMGEDGRAFLAALRESLLRVCSGEQPEADDKDQLRKLRRLFLTIGRRNLHQLTAARLEREVRPSGVA